MRSGFGDDLVGDQVRACAFRPVVPERRDEEFTSARADCDWLDSGSYVQTIGTNGAVSSKRSAGRYHSTHVITTHFAPIFERSSAWRLRTIARTAA
jgi:hypothetical protein